LSSHEIQGKEGGNPLEEQPRREFTLSADKSIGIDGVKGLAQSSCFSAEKYEA